MGVKWEKWEYTIPEHFTSYILYNDCSGIDQEEVEELDAWIKRELDSKLGYWAVGHWSLVGEPYDSPHNDVNKLYCRVQNWVLNVRVQYLG